MGTPLQSVQKRTGVRIRTLVLVMFLGAVSCDRGAVQHPTDRTQPNKQTMIPWGARTRRPRRLGEPFMRADRGRTPTDGPRRYAL
jgi:hypothetical protein